MFDLVELLLGVQELFREKAHYQVQQTFSVLQSQHTEKSHMDFSAHGDLEGPQVLMFIKHSGLCLSLNCLKTIWV